MRLALLVCSVLLMGWGANAPIYGDFVVFTVPTTQVKFVLPGKIYESRRTQMVNVTHTATKQVFDLPKGKETEVVPLLPLNQIGNRRIGKFKADEPRLREAAAWCLNHGLLAEFHKAMDQLSTLNASDPFVVEYKRLKEDLAKPLADTAALEAELMKDYGGATGRIIKGTHFVVVTSGEKPDKSEVKRKRPEMRKDQLEQFLEMFVMKCAERGLPVQVPTQPLKVAIVTTIPKKLRSAEQSAPLDKNIFWSASQNLLLIDEGSSIGPMKSIKKLQNDVQKAAAQPKQRRSPQPGGAPSAGGASSSQDSLSKMSFANLSKLTISLQALMQIGVENYEWESTSREAAYMLLANCSVVTNETPEWVRDGLAAYFEIPAEMGWTKIGDMGQTRNSWYQASLQDQNRITITDIVTGRCYDEGYSPHTSMRARTQAWALMLYIMEKKPDGLARYISNFQSMPPDVVLGEDVLTKIFDQAFESDRPAMEDEWRAYMAELKPDYEMIPDEEGVTPTNEN